MKEIISRLVVCFFVSLIFISCSNKVDLILVQNKEYQKQSKTIKFSNGIHFDVGNKWQAMSNEETIYLADWVDRIIPVDFETSLPFAANFFNNNKLIAKMNIRMYPEGFDISQSDVSNLYPIELYFLNNQIKTGIEMSFSKIEEISLNPPKMKKWKGTKLATINGKYFLVSNYTRENSIDKNDIFNVSLYRFLDKELSFTITLSYSELNKNLVLSDIMNIASSIIVE